MINRVIKHIIHWVVLIVKQTLHTAYCLLPNKKSVQRTAYCLLKRAYRKLHTAYCVLPTKKSEQRTAHSLLNTAYRKLRTAYCVLPTKKSEQRTAHSLLNTTYRKLPTCYCVLPTKKSVQRTAHSLLPTAYRKLPTANRLLRTITCLLLTANSLLLTAQNFPVQVIPQALPPAPIYFSNYADASTVNSPLRVQIVLNDFTIASREIRLKTYFQGNGISFQSNDIVVGASPLFLEGGTPLILTNTDLAPYFEFQNITGISPTVYGQPIPEGTYQFCFEVIDVLTGSRLSNRTCATAVVFQNEPPFLVSPRNKTNVDEQNPQYIFFQWTPRSINVTNVEYELSLVEIWDNQVDPQQAFLSSPPVFQTTVSATSYVYGPADPLLLSGKNYAWRVQAKAKSGTEEIGLFKNQGYSEIFSFSYAGSCDLPIGLNHEVKGSTNANIFWDDFSTEIPEFTVRYRQKNVSDAEWFLTKTTGNELTIWELKAGTTYEYQLSKNCGVTQSDWSFTKEFTTTLEFEEESVIDCGVSPDINLSNMEPLASLSVGQSFKAGDFPVVIKEISGSSGRFSGKGYVKLPYLENIKVAVEFTNILVNTDSDLAEGSVKTVYSGDFDKNVLNTADVYDVVEDIFDAFSDGDVNVEYSTPFEIESTENIKIENGKIVVTGPNGETETFDHDEGDSYIIKDSQGNTYNIDKDGKITKGAGAAQGGEATAANTDGISGGFATATDPSVANITATGVSIVFSKDTENTKYDFDIAESSYEKERYPKAKLPDGSDYYPIHKAVVNGKTDTFIATVDITNPDVVIDSLIFKTVKGTQIAHRKIDNTTIEVSVTGVNSYRSVEAIVTYKAKDGKYKIAASFFIHHIKQQDPVDVVVVSVNGTGDLSGLATDLNSIFNKAGGNFSVTTSSLSITETDWDTSTDNGILDYETNGFLSNATNYPAEFKNIYNKYKNDHSGYNKKAYYLFVLPNDIKASKALTGFMPKTRQWGFIFSDYLNSISASGKKKDLNLVAAHELGHGVFRLTHPFENEDSSGSGTNGLMDYENGNQLSYSDWAVMNDESLNIGLFQDREDGEHSSYEYIVGFDVVPGIFEQYIKKDEKQGISFVSASGKILTLPKDVKDVTFTSKGALFGFTVNENGKEERYIGAVRKAGTSEENFAGYLKSFSSQSSEEWVDRVYRDEISKTLSKETLVHFGKLNASPCGINLYSKIYANEAKDSWNSGGDKEPLNYADFTVGLEPINSTIIESAGACNSCKEGEEFYKNHLYLVKNNSETDIEALKGIAKLICSTDNPVDYEILVSQINKDNWEKNNSFWNGHERYLFSSAAEMFWKREDALPLYLEALQKVNSNIKTYNSRLSIESSKEEYYAALYYLNDDFLKTLSLEEKQDLLKLIFDHNFFISTSFFDSEKSDVSLIKKIVNNIDSEDIDSFLRDLASKEEYKADAKSKREMLFEVINVLEFSRLQEANIDVKIEALSRMLDGNLLRLFNTNYENVIAKLIKSVENSDAKIFLEELLNPEKGVDGQPIVYHLKERLGNFFSNDAYTDFFKELNRLVGARAEIESDTYGIVGDITWDVEQKDFVLVSFVRDRNNYDYDYNKTIHKVNITVCEKENSRNSKCANTINLIPQDSSPFDMVMIYFLKNVSPFSPLPTNAIYGDRGAIEGKGYAVPVLFLEHLKSDISEQRLENAAWNTFNVAITIATVGEGTAAISAVRVAAVSSRLAGNAGKNILLKTLGKQAFPLMDFVYTVGTTGYQFGTGDKLPKELETVSLFFSAKGAYDLIDGGLKGLAKLSQADNTLKLKVIEELDIRGPTGNQITLDELDDLVYNSKRLVDKSGNDELIRAWKEANASVLGTGKVNLLSKLTKAKYNKFKNFIDGLADESTVLYRLNLLDDVDLLKLAEDFDGFSDALKIKFKQPNYIDGWLAISKRAEMRLDEEILDAMFTLTTNHKSFVRTYPTELDNIFEKLGEARAGCKSCDSSKEIDLQVGNVKDIINNLEGTISKVGDDAQGLQQFLKEMGESSKKAKGGAFTLKTLNGKWAQLTEGGYSFTKFEGSIPDIETGHKLDALFRNPSTNYYRSIELKNWKEVKTIVADETSQFYQYIKSKT